MCHCRDIDSTFPAEAEELHPRIGQTGDAKPVERSRGGAGPMKILLSNIPEEGFRQSASLPLPDMTRLTEAIGGQTGHVEVELVLKNHEGTLEVTGHMRATLKPPCHRCLEPVDLQIDEDILVALVPEEDYEDNAGDIRLGAADLEVSYYRGDHLDLSRLLEDELLLAIPETVAGEDDDEACLICGKRLEEIYQSAQADDEHHPFAQMKEFLTEE